MHHLNKHMDYRNICDGQNVALKRNLVRLRLGVSCIKLHRLHLKNKKHKKQQQKTVTIPFLAIAINQFLFKFTRKGSYKTPGFPKHIHIHIYTL